jgi:hypothetical protein
LTACRREAMVSAHICTPTIVCLQPVSLPKSPTSLWHQQCGFSSSRLHYAHICITARHTLGGAWRRGPVLNASTARSVVPPRITQASRYPTLLTTSGNWTDHRSNIALLSLYHTSPALFDTFVAETTLIRANVALLQI